MTNEYIIACKRVDSKGPYVSSRVGHCMKCGHQVWVAASTPKIWGAKCICLQCIDWNEVDEVKKLTIAQIMDILDHK